DKKRRSENSKLASKINTVATMDRVLRTLFNLVKLNQDYIYELALMSRLWTGFFGTERCRTPKIFQNPDFSLKRRDFWVFL
ncbi:hypothetical protein, partial [Weissella confusa]|uniref:hypothetical protein n=1 Tax=Weissella confusa TaxID=1583 RepID=UPI001F36C166